jgi:NADPH:quinone reductase
MQTVDYVVNCNDTSQYWEALAELIRPLGRVCLLVDARQPHDINLYKRKSAGIEWEFMGARSVWPELDLSRHGSILKHAADWFEVGALQSTLWQQLEPASVEAFAEGHRQLEEGRAIGKIVVNFIPSEG